ncbi:MAG: hypothetical protein Q9M14_00920 [Mariprofundaceae bacterium]|nr:hypothetical protein [Mariprofundaceae bacterium]
MNYQRNIRNSSLRFTLRKTAMKLLVNWHECAKNKYNISNTIEFSCDELEIENDLVDSLSSAVKSLVRDKSRENKSTRGWSFGYICGHVQGGLNVKWSNQYLVEPSKEFNEYFEKLFVTNYMSLLETYDAMCCPDLTEYLNECEVINLVGKEHFA